MVVIEKEAERGISFLVEGKPVDTFADGNVARGAGDVMNCMKGYCCRCSALANLGGSAQARKPMSGSSPRVCPGG